MSELIRAPLRGVRGAIASATASLVSHVPSLEPWFVRSGRWLAQRSRLGGGLYWIAQDALIARLRRRGNRYREVPIGKLRLQVDITDATGRSPYFYSTAYEPAVTDAVVRALGSGDVFVDVGANVGYFSILAALLVGSAGRVLAFEPHEGARAALRGTPERNGVVDTILI